MLIYNHYQYVVHYPVRIRTLNLHIFAIHEAQKDHPEWCEQLWL